MEEVKVENPLRNEVEHIDPMKRLKEEIESLYNRLLPKEEDID